MKRWLVIALLGGCSSELDAPQAASSECSVVREDPAPKVQSELLTGEQPRGVVKVHSADAGDAKPSLDCALAEAAALGCTTEPYPRVSAFGAECSAAGFRKLAERADVRAITWGGLPPP